MVVVESQRDDDPARGLLVGSRPRRVEHVLEAPRPVGEVAAARRACAARRSRGPRRGARPSPAGRRSRRAGRPRPRWRPRWASRSPRRSVGARELATRIATTSAVRRTGGTAQALLVRSRWRRAASSPGPCRRRRRGGPGSRPSRPGAPSTWTGATRVMSLRWVPPANGSLSDDWSPGSTRPAAAVDRGAHRRRHRPEVHRDVLGLDEQLAGRGEQRGRAVGPLLDVGAERGAPQHRAHLLGDPGERGP